MVERATYILNQEAKRRRSGSFLMFWCPPSSNSLGIKPLTHEYMGDTQSNCWIVPLAPEANDHLTVKAYSFHSESPQNLLVLALLRSPIPEINLRCKTNPALHSEKDTQKNQNVGRIQVPNPKGRNGKIKCSEASEARAKPRPGSSSAHL